MSTRAYVCVVTAELHFPAAGSLKGKRKQLSSLKAQVQRRFNAAVAEVDHQDLWQRSTLAIALVAGSEAELRGLADRVERHLVGAVGDGVQLQRTLRSLADLEP